MDKEYMRLAAKEVAAKLPDNHGFILLVAPFGDDSRLCYTSNIDRSDAINILKEFMINSGAAEDWMKHIK